MYKPLLRVGSGFFLKDIKVKAFLVNMSNLPTFAIVFV